MHYVGCDYQWEVNRNGSLFLDLLPIGASYFHTKHESTLYVYFLIWCFTFQGERPNIFDRIAQEIGWLLGQRED